VNPESQRNPRFGNFTYFGEGINEVQEGHLKDNIIHFYHHQFSTRTNLNWGKEDRYVER
jgi:hypothetical protein